MTDIFVFQLYEKLKQKLSEYLTLVDRASQTMIQNSLQRAAVS